MRSKPSFDDLDPYTADPEDARIALEGKLHEMLEMSKGGAVYVDYQDFWYIWRMSCRATMSDDGEPSTGMMLILLTLGGIAFICGLVIGAVL